MELQTRIFRLTAWLQIFLILPLRLEDSILEE